MRRVETALVVWSLLTLSAIKRQTLTYQLLSQLVGVSRHDLGRLLEPIQSYCILENLPPLTSLVVGSRTGMPGEGFIAASNLPQAQAETFAHDWCRQTVPTPDDFRRAVETLPSCGLSLGELMRQIR
ncbi:MAG: hypothetical protein QNJ61_13240 [Desulfobacterales bacterium]|nr:hypothetical protein [Desulfobacterales bacterium]